jgi:hypothetical protein
MKKVIKVLEEKISICEGMAVLYYEELQKHQHLTADQREIQRLKILQQENIDIYNECLIAVDLFKNK